MVDDNGLPQPGLDRDEWGTPLNNFLLAQKDQTDTNTAGISQALAGLDLKADAAATTAALAGKADLVSGKLNPTQLPLGTTSSTALAGNTTAAQIGGVAQGTLVVNASDAKYAGGAKGDGVTDDAAAINAAITAANAAAAFGATTVRLPWTPTGYVSSAIVLKSNVTLAGDAQVLLKRTGVTTSYFININATTTNAGVTGLTIDPAGLASSAILNVQGIKSRIIGNTFTTSAPLPQSVHAVQAIQGSDTTLIYDNDFNGLLDNVRVYANANAVTVLRNRFTNWGNRCVFVIGTATQASTDLRIAGNLITNVNTATSSADPTWLGAAGNPRQPIAIQGVAGAWHARPHIRGNTVIGNGLAHHQGNDGGTLLGGTADMISMHFCENFEASGNICVNGGEAGFTIANQSRRGSLIGNTVVGCNTTPVALGGSGVYGYDVTIVGNTFANNGKELSPPATGDRAGVHAAVWCSPAQGVLIDGNTILDDNTGTQRYVVYMNGSDAIRVGTNTTRGLLGVTDPTSTTTAHYADPLVTAVKPAATTRNNTAAVTADPDLTVPVEGSATYLLEAYVPSNATATADVQLKWLFPAATTITWTTDGPNISGTSSNTTVNRLEYNQNSTAVIGGVGTSAVSKLVGTVITGAAGGALTLQWAQNTAEASDTTLSAGAWLRLTRVK